MALNKGKSWKSIEFCPGLIYGRSSQIHRQIYSETIQTTSSIWTFAWGDSLNLLLIGHLFIHIKLLLNFKNQDHRGHVSNSWLRRGEKFAWLFSPKLGFYVYVWLVNLLDFEEEMLPNPSSEDYRRKLKIENVFALRSWFNAIIK